MFVLRAIQGEGQPSSLLLLDSDEGSSGCFACCLTSKTYHHHHRCRHSRQEMRGIFLYITSSPSPLLLSPQSNFSGGNKIRKHRILQKNNMIRRREGKKIRTDQIPCKISFKIQKKHLLLQTKRESS